MKLNDLYDGSNAPFQGDYTILLRSIPVNSRIQRATMLVTPVDQSSGLAPFTERIVFNGALGDWGATKTKVVDRWVEVDFHARRTLAAVRGVNLKGASLQVDLGGAYVEINQNGAIKTPSDTVDFPIDGNFVPLPGLTVTKLKLTRLATSGPDLAEVIISSVPTNVSLRIGPSPFWIHVGEMSGPESTPDYAAVLQAALGEAKVENGFYVVPLVLHSDTIARLKVAIEIELVAEQSVLPSGLNQVTLPFDYSGAPKVKQDSFSINVPLNARVAQGGVTARIAGDFEASRIIYGPIGTVAPVGTAQISPGISLAQIISTKDDATVTAIDLLLALTQSTRLQLDLRDNMDGKPDDVSLLSRPVAAELLGAVGQELDQQSPPDPQWVNIQLPAEFKFNKGRKYWLILQSIEGEAALGLKRAPAGSVPLQRTENGGLSWRETTVPGFSGSVSGLLRLRHLPERFQMPIEIQVGEGENSVKVNLDRFELQGRVDFTLDFDEVSQAINQYLNKATAACPEADHIANGNFEQWLRIGDDLLPPVEIALATGQVSEFINPTAVGITSDGAWAYVVGAISGQSPGNLLQVVDVACNKKFKDVDLSVPPTAIAMNPIDNRAYIAGGNMLHVIDTSAHAETGAPIKVFDQSEGRPDIRAMAVSPDGSRLYVLASSSAGDPVEAFAIDTASLDQNELAVTAHVSLSSPQPAALTVSPDGSRLYIASHERETPGEVRILNAATLAQIGPIIQVGNEPSGIAISFDGKLIAVANKTDDTVHLIDTATVDLTKTGPATNVNASSVAVGDSPAAVAISPDGKRAYVANQLAGNVSVIDLALRKVISTAELEGAKPKAIALAPQGDRLFLVPVERQSLYAIQIGRRLPSEWNLTSGNISLECLPDPSHLVSVLGYAPQAQNPMATGLSQVAPVTAPCAYEFSFLAMANHAGAVAELLWLSDECGLLRRDEIPIEVRDIPTQTFVPPPPIPITTPPAMITTSATSSVMGTAAQLAPLSLHRVRQVAPAGANQVEVRFNVPVGVMASVDRVSLIATDEAVENGDLKLQKEGQLTGWSLSPKIAQGFVILAGKDGVQLKNAGTNDMDLAQTVAVKSGQPFVLEVQGQATALTSAKANPRIELHWLTDDGSPAGPDVILEMQTASFGASVASGTTPSQASKVEIHLVTPAGATQEIKRLSLRFSSTTAVPVKFVSHAPGQLTISDWKVSLEQQKAVATPVPQKGLCKSTPPNKRPGQSSNGSCFCASCETEQPMAEAMPAQTRAGRPVQVGRCLSCGAEMVQFGGQPSTGATALSLQTFEPRRTVVHFSPAAAVQIREARSQGNGVALPPLTAIGGIGPVRSQKLSEAGIDSIVKLAAATSEKVAQITGVIVEVAAEFISEAKRLVTSLG